jgi:prepilin-type N-terminal cleavage/methylation domain-containing protein/prepilin-type processing-associated H-X9-DG protein
MRVRRRGFTLIELLVVIAIIGILAAMLFPVFARARESARKIQCLSNVKNIALAIQMYLADYDAWFPWGATADASEHFRSSRTPAGTTCNRAMKGNPYLREPVILDEYIKNRDVWRCPSAKLMNGASTILPPGRDNYWLNNYLDHPEWKDDAYTVLPCNWPYPSGWGGTVTDSWLQGWAPVDGYMGLSGGGAFVQGIGVNDNPHTGGGLAAMNDPAKYVVCADVGWIQVVYNNAQTAFPDLGCAGTCGEEPGCCGTADWDNCPWSTSCGLDYDGKTQLHEDSNFRRSRTRHMGGSNIGFADGHAKWFHAETILTGVSRDGSDISKPLDGLCDCSAWK